MRRTYRAFTLVQILIAITIMALAIIPLSKLFVISSKNVKKSEAILEASVFAATIIDSISSPQFVKENVNKIFYLPQDANNIIKQDLDAEDKSSSYVDAYNSFAYVTSFGKKNMERSFYAVKDVPEHFKKYYKGRAYYIIKREDNPFLENLYRIKVKVIWQEMNIKKVLRMEVLKSIIEEDKLGNSL
jgi:hypothetical protein